MKLGHREIMARLARENGWKVGVELGVKNGQLTNRLLSACPGLHLIGVDHWLVPENKARAFAVAALYPGRVIFHVCRTEDAAALVPDGSVDFVFIDADHGYESVVTDIRLWRSKVRPGGWFGGHDFGARFPGVVQAVREAYGDRIVEHGSRVWQAVTP